MRLPVRSTLALLSLTTLGGMCGPPAPEDDRCADPSDAVATSIDVGSSTREFRPYVDGSVASPVFGSQGGVMLPVRIRLEGDALPECIAQHTTLTDVFGDVYTETGASFRTHPDGEGAWTTQEFFLIFDSMPNRKEWITLTAEAGGAEVSRSMWYEEPYDGPEVATLTAPAPVAVGESFRLGITLDGPIGEDGVSIRLRASDPSVVRVDSSFGVISTATEINVPAFALAEGSVEIVAVTGRVVQSVAVTVSASAAVDAGL